MTDYMPVFLPGEAMTLSASAPVTGGQLVEVSGSGTVAPVTIGSAPSVKVVGVAGHDAAANKPVTIYARGTVHESIAIGTVTAGDQVGSPVSGTEKAAVATVAVSAIDVGGTPTQTSINNAVNGGLNVARGVLGVALTTASNPAKVRWMSF